jgi:hypothetical protein
MRYHKWLNKEGIENKIPRIYDAEHTVNIIGDIAVGIGLHDSSSAIIPYMINFTEPFVLLSTGTWSISMNPFNDTPLTFDEMQYDCLCYLQYKEKPVKAARLFAGNEHEVQTQKLASHFGVPLDFYKEILFDKNIISKLVEINLKKHSSSNDKYKILQEFPFAMRNLSDFKNYEIAYHQLMLDIVEQQILSTQLVIYNSPVKKIFVDGGFGKNSIFYEFIGGSFSRNGSLCCFYAASKCSRCCFGDS